MDGFQVVESSYAVVWLAFAVDSSTAWFCLKGKLLGRKPIWRAPYLRWSFPPSIPPQVNPSLARLPRVPSNMKQILLGAADPPIFNFDGHLTRTSRDSRNG